MLRFLHILLMLSLFLSSTVHAETNTSSVKIAFVRDGYLWLKTVDKEEKLTDGKAVFPSSPQWLADLNGEDAKVWIHEVESYAFYPS